MSTLENHAETLAAKLVSALLALGRHPCNRVQLMVGRYPHDEPDGGMCREAMVELFTKVIKEDQKP